MTPLPAWNISTKDTSFTGLSTDADETSHSGLPTKRSWKRIVSAASSFVCVGALLTATLFPLNSSAAEPLTTQASIQPQKLFSEEDAGPVADALQAVSIKTIPLPPNVTAEKGLVDASSLSDSSVRYPFDEQWPNTDSFGYRTEPVAQFHDAQDIGAPGGTSIRAIASGVVLEAGFATDGCGFGLKLQHNINGQDLTSRYCHMEANSHSYQVGDTVKIGDEAGRVGNTGMSFGPHLHLALRLNGEPIDPLPYIQANEK
ncbi:MULTISPECIES: M23 family metallopeptidase [Leucobacter]|uniref:Peptidase family M23 n=1 Tax=Leucobacter chromiiresistens TaxID=1079994 RepID=A0A1H0YIJ6_9MICO|nr:M23 family metallopeptidase [Leucobacter chromiiresistens]SDQ14893.1 Peptidase family M23 [Leucobacter chromiiresistens]